MEFISNILRGLIRTHCRPENQERCFLKSPHTSPDNSTNIIRSSQQLLTSYKQNTKATPLHVRKLFPLQKPPAFFRRGRGPPLRANKLHHACPSSLRAPPSGREPPPWGAHHGISSTPLVPELTVDPVCGPKPTFVWNRCAAAAIGIRGSRRSQHELKTIPLPLSSSHFLSLCLLFHCSNTSIAIKVSIGLHSLTQSITTRRGQSGWQTQHPFSPKTSSGASQQQGTTAFPPPSNNQLTPFTVTKLKAPQPPTVVVPPFGTPSARAPGKLQTVPREP